MPEANLTRCGPLTLKRAPGQTVSQVTHFKAVAGAGQLRLHRDVVDALDIRLNGEPLSVPPVAGAPPEIHLDVTLARDNVLAVEIGRGAAGAATLRVTQRTEADLGLVRQGYFGLNTRDIQRQRAFYEMLGFVGEIYPAGPETSTTFARALGFADDYLIHVSLHSLKNPPEMPFVDTVEFRADSFRDEPPYAQLNHLGMAYATYASADLDGAIDYLTGQGVKFLSAPVTVANGERFVFMQEPDGAYIKLVASAAQPVSPYGAQLVRLVNTNMNVSDLERSREFYRLLGFTESKADAQAGEGALSAAYGFTGPIAFTGVDVSLGEGTDGATIQLRQWLHPYDDAAPYPPPVNHLGIDRINFYVKDLTAAVSTMNALGFEQLGPIGGMPEVGIVFFYDPDGIKVQLAGPQTG